MFTRTPRPRTPNTPNSTTSDGERRKSVLDETVMEDNRPGTPGHLKIYSEFPAFADVLKLKL